MVSNHYKTNRYSREKFINKQFKGDGNIIDSFIVDRNHPKGAEIHYVTDNGLIIVRNQRTGKLVTKLIARPNQVKKLYNSVNREPPQWLTNLCFYHQVLHYNR